MGLSEACEEARDQQRVLAGVQLRDFVEKLLGQGVADVGPGIGLDLVGGQGLELGIRGRPFDALLSA